MMAKRPTLADVATQAGASKAAVSLVLNNRESRISEETAERIKVAAEELGYTPNQAAQTLRTGKTHTLAFISDEVLTTRFASAMVHGILETAEKYNQMILMAETEHSAARWTKSLNSMKSRQVDGYILGLMRARDLKEVDLPVSKPAVVVNGRAAGVASILPHEFEAGRRAVEHLLTLGHTRIGLIGRHPAHTRQEQSTMNIPRRLAGLDEAMREAGLNFAAEYEEIAWEGETGYLGTHSVLNIAPDITAIIAANDRVAFGVYRALAERGLSIPKDVSVISFDDEELASYMHPGLTTLRLPYAEMGQTATQILLQENPTHFAQNLTSSGNEVLIPMPLIERESTSSPRR